MGDRAFYTFIQSLPDKERKLVLWLKGYERELKEHPDLTEIITNLYEPEINQQLQILPQVLPEHFQEPSKVTHQGLSKQDIILSKDPFEEKLGKWASDLSDNEIERLICDSESL